MKLKDHETNKIDGDWLDLDFEGSKDLETSFKGGMSLVLASLVKELSSNRSRLNFNPKKVRGQRKFSLLTVKVTTAKEREKR